MATVYLSYKLEDRDLANRLAEQLDRAGHRAVYDAVALSPGEHWLEVLLGELAKADAVVVLLTERALQSPFVLGEIGAARMLHFTTGRVLTIPVLVGDLPIPPVVSDLFVIRMAAGDEGIRVAADGIVRALANHVARRRGGHPRIFISHRHRHAPVAEAAVRVIEAAFVVEPSDIRCTSVHPYRLRAGERTADRLRGEIARAEAVLGLITPDARDSNYVLFELGASWGQTVTTFPLLAAGATLDDVPSPIGDLHTLSLQREDECHQLVDDLADVTTLRRKERGGPQLAQRIVELVAAASAREQVTT